VASVLPEVSSALLCDVSHLFPEFDNIIFVDTEFQTEPAGSRPRPVSLCALNGRTGQKICLFRGEFGNTPPYPTGANTLIVAYYASAEIGFHLALHWPVPVAVLDLYVVFRNITNGLYLPHGAGLVGAMAYSGLDYPADKPKMIEIINRGNWTAQERSEIIEYNWADVIAMTRLLPRMYPYIDRKRALYRGQYPAVAAAMEWRGVPIDVDTLLRLRRNWEVLQDRLIAKIDQRYGAYDGRHFREARFAAWLAAEGIPWPRLESGRLDLEDDTFRDVEKSYPEKIGPLRELRHALSQLRLEELAVDLADGRNRTLSSYYRARTSRSQPSNSKSIFGPSVWLRGLIKPEPGRGLVVSDYSQQEFGVGAALSGDPVMMRAYESGDSYLGFAEAARAVPPGTTQRFLRRRGVGLDFDEEDQHTFRIRELYKPTVLAIQYGRGENALARTLDLQPIQARDLIQQSHRAFKAFWAWSDARVNYALLNRRTSTVLGWQLHLAPDSVEEVKGRIRVKSPNVRSLQNFPMQANAAEMTRLAAMLAHERGIAILLTVHDAIIAESDLNELAATKITLEECMVEASRIILGGFALRLETKLIRYQERYSDKRGKEMWGQVMNLLDEIEGTRRAA